MGVLGVLAIGARGGSKCWRGAERSVWREPEGYGRNLPAVPGEVAGRLVGRFARKSKSSRASRFGEACPEVHRGLVQPRVALRSGQGKYSSKASNSSHG